MMTPKIAVTLGLFLLLCTCVVCGTWYQVVKSRSVPALTASPEAVDSAGRYQLKEFRHGSIVGLAMVDGQIGRVWVLAGGTSADVSKITFEEVEVEALWQKLSITDATNPALAPDLRNMAMKNLELSSRIKGMTRPKVVRDAAQEATRAQAGAASTNPPKQKPN